MLRRSALSLAILAPLGLASAALPSAPATAPDAALQGCWRATRIVLHTPDGARAEDTSGRCTLRFAGSQLESVCLTSRGLAATTYRHAVVRPGVYAATMEGSSFRTDLVGSTREYAYRIEGDRLHTASVPPAPEAALVQAMPPRVETQAVRSPCP